MFRPLLALDEALQPAERVVPLFRDQLEMSMDLFETARLQLPDALAAVSRAAHETGIFHHAQVFGDRLTGDGEPSGQLRDRHRTVVAEARDQTDPRLVAKRRKHGCRTYQCS